jgi:hypothetical protein
MSPAESFGWLHLTDLHYGLAGQSTLWPNVREAFFADLREMHGRCGPWQAVLFSGDLVQSGAQQEFKAMETEALGLLRRELATLGSGDAALLAVPGNHDLVRPNANKPSAATRQLLRPGGFAEVEEEFWGDPDGEYRQVVSTALVNYQAWWEGAELGPQVAVIRGILAGDFAATLRVSARAIGIVGLNTTFLQLAAGNYVGRLAWGLQQLQAVCGDVVDWCARHDSCLLLTHQGREWFDPRSQQEYPEINPAGRFAVHLFGHMHETVVRSTSHGGGKPVREWQGCSLFGLEKFGDPPRLNRKHGYGAGRIEFGRRQAMLRLFPRRAVRDANGWRFIPDQESCVLKDDGGTAPEPIGRLQAPRHGVRGALPRLTTAPAGEKASLVASFARAARALWDIIDLAGLPEDERHLAMQHFLLRQLYLPLRMTLQKAQDDETLAALEEDRERRRLTTAGRAAEAPETASKEEAPRERESLGGWLRSVLSRSASSGGNVLATEEACTPRLIILGDPGGGKTTLLRWLATACLMRVTGDPDLARLPDADTLPATDWLPILVRCRELDRTRLDQCNLEELLRQAVARMELPGIRGDALVALLRTRVDSGAAILLIDGLDEITDPGQRATFCVRIEGIANSYPRVPILATSRIVGYREMRRRLGHGFAHATLAELTAEEKDEFVGRWCEVTIVDPARRASEAEKLRRAMHGSDRIERLTTNPMLLTTMALVQRRVGKLPTRRHKLYWEAVNVLLNWRPEVEDPMDPDEALPQLEYLAYSMCDRGVQRLRRDEVIELLERMRGDYPNIRPVQRQAPEGFLAQLERRTGLFVEVGEVTRDGKPVPVYEFRHLTFQEYLAALAILVARYPGHKQGTTLAERVRPLAGKLAADESGETAELLVAENWREAIRLCVASCNDDDVDAVLAAILEPDRREEERPRAILALLCLCDEPNVTQDRAGEILGRFARRVTKEEARVRSSGVMRAVGEVSGSVWAEPLRRILAAEFLRHRWDFREYPGYLCGRIGSSTGESGLLGWTRAQLEALTSPSDLDCVAAALTVIVTAYERSLPGAGTSRRPPLAPAIFADRLIPLLDRGPALAHAASWALAWLYRRAPRLPIEGPPWKVDPRQLGATVTYLSRRDSDPGALRWLLSVVRDTRLRDASAACQALMRHEVFLVRLRAREALIAAAGSKVARSSLRKALQDPDAGVRRESAEYLGKLLTMAATKSLKEALQDPDEGVRRAALLALVAKRRTNAVLLSQDLDGEPPGLDPQETISLEHAEQAAQEVSWKIDRVIKRYESLASQYDLRLGWRGEDSSKRRTASATKSPVARRKRPSNIGSR